MLTFIFGLLCALLSVGVAVLDKAYHHVPAKELKRRARRGDELAKLLYRPAAYGGELQLLLWTAIVLLGAGSVVLFSVSAPAWLAFIIIVLLLWLSFAWTPPAQPGSLAGYLARWLAPFVAKLLHYTHPLFRRLEHLVRLRSGAAGHTGLYEKNDLLELLDWQKQQPDNRIAVGELDIAQNIIEFGDKSVGDIAVARRHVKMLAADETLGPLLMDDLHRSGYTDFPVYAGKKANIVGMLSIADLSLAKHGGKISTLMRPAAAYLHETYSLYQALQAFLKTKQHVFIVVDNTAEFIGIITIEDVLTHIIGQPTASDSIPYEDRQAVADSTTPPAHTEPEKADIESVEVLE